MSSADVRPSVPGLNRERLIALCFVLLNLGLCVYLAWALNIWTDEADALHTTDGSLRYAFDQALGFENQAPLYYIVLDLWRSLDHSIFFARLFSVLCIGLSLIALWRFSETRRLSPACVVAVVAVNPVVVALAIEARSYALVILLATLLTIAFLQGFWDRPDRRWQLGYGLLAVAALYTHYYVVFLLVAQALLMLARRPAALPAFVVTLVGVVVLFAPMAALLHGQMAVNLANVGARPSFHDDAVQLVVAILRFVFPLPLVHHAALGMCAAIAIAMLAGLFASGFKLDARSWAVYPWMTLLGAAAMLAGVTILGSNLISERYVVFLLAPAVLTMFVFFRCLRTDRRAAFAAVWTACVVAASAFTLWFEYRDGAKPGDWKRVAIYLEANERPLQPIAVFPADQAMPLGRYYDGANQLVPLPHAVTFERFNIRERVLQDQAQITAAFTPAQRHAREIWLVRFDECTLAGVDLNCPALDRFLQEHYRVRSSRSFVGTQVELLQRTDAR